MAPTYWCHRLLLLFLLLFLLLLQLLRHGSGPLLHRVLWQLGEEPLAKRITAAILSHRQHHPQQLEISELVDLIRSCAPLASKKETTRLMSRVFQVEGYSQNRAANL